jgi:hypothetical protein
MDNRKTLLSGAANPNYHKFVIFEPYSEVVREYWQLFLRYGGQIRPMLRHILEHGPYYPDPSACPPPEGFRVVYRLQQHEGKWCPTTRTGLRQMFTNGLYAGHWIVNGSVIIWNNHPAIIEPDTFMRAFNYLSETGLDGKPNPHYAPIAVHARPSKAEDREEAWPLCAGLIFTEDEGRWVRVGVKWEKTITTYMYHHWSRTEDTSVWRKKAATVDSIIANVMIDKIKATFNFDAWEQAVAKIAVRVGEEHKLRQAQLKQLQTVMDNLVANLATLQHPQMIKAAEQQYAAAEREFQRLRQEIAAQQAETVSVEQVRQLRDSCGEIMENWPNLSCDEQREVLHTFVNRVEATPASDNGLDLRIYWNDGGESSADIPNQRGPYDVWTEEENRRVVALIESEADQLEICRAFPNRSWYAIQYRYQLMVKSEERVKIRRKLYVNRSESYNEYLARTGKASEIAMTSESHLWVGHPTESAATARYGG